MGTSKQEGTGSKRAGSGKGDLTWWRVQRADGFKQNCQVVCGEHEKKDKGNWKSKLLT